MKTWKTALLCSIGSGLEYYDFVIYIMLAPFLTEIFFPAKDKSLNLILILGIFAAAYVVRPLGGILFGHFADCYGRKKAFLTSILLMSISTFAIGLLPPFKMVGMVSPILLVAMRLLQGLSQGAEIPGAITFLSEHAHAQKRGKYLGLLMSGIAVGAVLSSWVNLGLAKHFTEHQILAYAWRIPFLLGGLLAIVGYILRRKAVETALFTSQPPAVHMPIAELFRKHKLALLQCIGIILFPACLIISALFFPVYLNHYFAYHLADIYSAMTISLIGSVIMLLVFGYLSDYVGRKFLMITASLVAILFLSLLFKMLLLGTFHSLLAFMILYQMLISCLIASYPSMLAEIFVTKIRYTGVAVSYNFSYTIAAFFPMFLSILINHTQRAMLVSTVLSGLAALSFIILIFTRDRTGKSLI
ncbi:MAG: MFS transporter [Gammaproteobacteria bacterium]|nr:MFS transporter [Gammaproteobacteria bacterium]